MPKANIRQIAQTAGVSVAAVSYVLNGKPGVSAGTRERILQVIREMNYTPNMNSRRLSCRRSFNLFLVTDPESTLTNLFYSAIVGALLSECTVRGYNLVLSAREARFSESAAYRAILESNTDGLIFLFTPDCETLSLLRQEEIPFVVVDDHCAEPDYTCVQADYALAVRTATEYLLELGHRKIALLGRSDLPDFLAATGDGFRKAMTGRGLPFREEWITGTNGTPEEDGLCVRRLLSGEDRPTAFVCAGDLQAITGMTEAQSMGFDVPEDVSFVGVDDLPVSRLYYPALTTVHIDARAMAGLAAELLDRQMRGEKEIHVAHVPSADLICRKSAAAPGAPGREMKPAR